jgi:hypothetical protein
MNARAKDRPSGFLLDTNIVIDVLKRRPLASAFHRQRKRQSNSYLVNHDCRFDARR